MSDRVPPLSLDVGDKLVAVHRALDRASIEHAFGGAIALAYAVADPRATNDLDINVSTPVGDAGRVIDALPDGVTSRPDVLTRIRDLGQDRLRWGDMPIDLFFPQHDFHAVVAARATRQPFRATTIPVITPTDLTVFKALFDRRKDWPDIEAMLRAGAVDESEALRWLGVIVGSDHPTYGRLVELIREVRDTPADPADVDPNVWRRRAPT